MSDELKIIDEILLRFEDANLSAPAARKSIGAAILSVIPGRKTNTLTEANKFSKAEILDAVRNEYSDSFLDYFAEEEFKEKLYTILGIVGSAIEKITEQDKRGYCADCKRGFKPGENRIDECIHSTYGRYYKGEDICDGCADKRHKILVAEIYKDK